MDLRRTCQTALSVTQKDRSREHAGTSHMCSSSEPQLRIEESSNGQTGDGPRSRNPGGLSQKPDNKHKSALQAGPDTGQVHDGEEAQCTLTGNGRSVDHVQVMIMSNGSHHSSGGHAETIVDSLCIAYRKVQWLTEYTLINISNIVACLCIYIERLSHSLIRETYSGNKHPTNLQKKRYYYKLLQTAILEAKV